MLLTLCVHNGFLLSVALANRAVIDSLEKRIQLEVLTETREDVPLRHRTAGVSGKAEYNQSLLALLQHARGKYVMYIDPADRLQGDHILKAIRLMEKKADIIAVAGGIRSPEHAFLANLAPQGVLMRREEACRFLHAMEYDLVGCWHSLAQLARSGQVQCMPYNLSERRRPEGASLRQVDVRDLFFDISVPERYLGEVCLYDPVTLERHLSDAEKFLLLWPSFRYTNTQQRMTLMFEKRAALYAMASKQAKSDRNMTMYLHFRLRSKMVMPRLKNNKLAQFLTRFLRKAGAGEAILQQAVAKQLRLEVSLLGEKATLYIENTSALKAMEKGFGGMTVHWLDRKLLLFKAPSPEEVIVFRKNGDVQDRLRRIPQAQPGRHFAYEDIRQQLVPA